MDENPIKHILWLYLGINSFETKVNLSIKKQ